MRTTPYITVMEVASKVEQTWIEPGAKLQLYSLTHNSAIHYAKPGEERALCGAAHSGYMSRGIVLASNVYVQKRPIGDMLRRVAAKTDCIRCMESYCKNMRRFEPAKK